MGTVTRRLTPQGHIEERLKTLRKLEGVRVRPLLTRKRAVPSDEFDVTGKKESYSFASSLAEIH